MAVVEILLFLRNSLTIAMRYLSLAFVLLGFLYACSQIPEADGHEIYKTYCVSCHGAKGNMGGNGAFDLSASALGLEERVRVIHTGRNTMTSFKALLSPEQIRAVAEYTLELKQNQ